MIRLVSSLLTQYPDFRLPNREVLLRKEGCANRSRVGIRAALALAILLIAISLPALAVVVSFPDPGLEAAIRDAIGKPTGDILDTDLVGLWFLDAWNRGISNLEGIQYCTDLMNLSLDSNQIVDISPLSGLTNLTGLYLSTNQIVDISPLSGLTDLEYLYLSTNQIVNITALSGLTNLTWLLLSTNQIVDITALSGLTSLTELSLGLNQIVDISPLSSLTDLEYLYLSTNQILDLAPLVGNAGIGSGDDVDVRWNHLCLAPGLGDMEDINTLLGRGVNIVYTPQTLCVVNFPDPGLEEAIRDAIGKPTGDILDSDLVGLTVLTACNWSISNLEGIQYCTDLAELDLDDNQIVEISELSGLTNLGYLWLSENQIVDISALSDLSNLMYLYLYNNQIVDISALSGLTNLTDLWLHYNQIVDISALSGLTDLTELYLYNNQIVDISAVSSLTNLMYLRLYNNQIVDISALSGLTNLSDLRLDNNQIVDLAPLVSNAGIGSGDSLDVRWNHLCLAPGLGDIEDINTLLGRVIILYTPQTVCAETSAVFKVDEQGNVLADQTFHAAAFETEAADIAEWVHITALAEPGDVVEFDPAVPGRYRIAQTACSSLVAGVISTAPGVILGGSLVASERELLALTGIVPVKVTNEGGPILPGDLLVTSSTPGHAMRWAGPDPCLCSMVGKALEPMTEEFGVILVLLTAH